ncbi:MAG: undecaprenyl-phosphate glucose phosphotransferase [Pirellulales bacterium]|nr:undecaprenyl-phosphate glucose phosphotransferase [Pirellulales bacterium]
MYRRHGDKLALVFLGCDLAVTAAVWIGAYWLRFALWDSPYGVPEFRSVVRELPVVLVLAAVSYRLCGLYEVHRLRQLPSELGVVCKAGGLLFLLAITVTFYRRDVYESRLALALFLALNALALTLVRRAIWQAVKYLRGRGLNRGRAVIVGSGRTGRRVAAAILDNAWTGLEAIGFVDRPRKVRTTILPWLGTVDQLGRIAADHDVDHVFVALPLSRYGELPEVYEALSNVLVEVQLVPDVPNTAGMKLRMLEIDDLAFLGLRQSPHYGWPRMAKRAMDLVLGSAALVLLAPLMAALAVAVKWTSPGPIFYRQARLGLHGKTFEMLKFRSMPPDAEDATGPVWARRDDRRCTRLGRFMRRWSLDELPQLFNVLAGNMSLVGPRPERAVFVREFCRQIPDYAQRHTVQAGMTGWAQVHGWRGDTSVRNRIRCDLYYVSHWSLWLDLQILWMTAWRGLGPRRPVVRAVG